jgi:hypothetical protein
MANLSSYVTLAIIFASISAVGGLSSAYAQTSGQMTATTSKGTAVVIVEPDWSSNPTKFTVHFLDAKTQQPIQHVYFDFRIIKDGNQVFSLAKSTNQPIIHIVGGNANDIMYSFDGQGKYQIDVFLEGTGLPEVPTGEDATFPIQVTPEFPAGTAIGVMAAIMVTVLVVARKTKALPL